MTCGRPIICRASGSGNTSARSLLETAKAAGDSVELDVVFDEVRRVARHPAGGWMVHLAREASLPADAVILTVGHRPPSDPAGMRWSGPRTRFIPDPWRPFATNVVGPDDPAIVLGTGLTAVNAVLSLGQQPRRAPITLISRNGLTAAVPSRDAAAPGRPECDGLRAGRHARRGPGPGPPAFDPSGGAPARVARRRLAERRGRTADRIRPGSGGRCRPRSASGSSPASARSGRCTGTGWRSTSQSPSGRSGSRRRARGRRPRGVGPGRGRCREARRAPPGLR